MRAVHLDVSQQGHVVARIKLAEMRPQKAGERTITAGKLIQVGRIALVSKELYAAIIEERRFFRQLAGFLILFSQLTGDDLAGFNVRLIEGVDFQNRSRYCRGNLPAEEFLPQIVSIRQFDFDNRMASASKS